MAEDQTIRVLIADDISDTRGSLTKLLKLEDDIDVVGVAQDGLQAVDMADKLQPDVILMDVHMPGLDGVAATEAIRKKWPQVQVIMMSVHDEPEYFRKSMMAGARDFFIKPFTGEELSESIRRVHRSAPQITAQTYSVAETNQGQIHTPAEIPQGKIITVFSAKGGVGCTTLACNLAVAIASDEKKKAALVDCNLPFGDVGLFLNMRFPKTMVDLVPYVDELDDEMVNGVMPLHDSGLKVLLGPPRPEMAELVTGDSLKKMLEKLRSSYEYVVVDTWPSFQESVLAVLDVSDRILLVLTLEMPAIKNAKLFLEIADALGYPGDKVSLVVNRSDSSGGIELSDVESTLKRRVVGTIVSDGKLVTKALNLGVPFVMCAKDSKVSKGVSALAEHIVAPAWNNRPASVADSKAPKEKSGGVGRFFGAIKSNRNESQPAVPPTWHSWQ
jgi:pilus assembly protein CpaE